MTDDDYDHDDLSADEILRIAHHESLRIIEQCDDYYDAMKIAASILNITILAGAMWRQTAEDMVKDINKMLKSSIAAKAKAIGDDWRDPEEKIANENQKRK